MTMKKRRLINVSNRLPVQIRKQAGSIRVTPSSGGLATALNSAWGDRPGVWIGWPGTAEAPQQVEQMLSRASKDRNYTLQGVTLSEHEVAKFYSGFANEIIWPLFHDMSTRCNFAPDYWETYQQVNRKFATITAQHSDVEDFIWAHDYHLMLMAAFMREQGSRARIGFFLHIPFPAPDIFEKLPWREPVLRALLKYDLLGFQTDRDRRNFASCLRRLVPDVKLEEDQQEWQVLSGGEKTRLGTFPISIDFKEFAEQAAKPEITSRTERIRKDFSDGTLVLGVDRMDYTKGIPERLLAFQILLRKFPEMRRQVTLVQVVVPSREDIPGYRELRRDVELLVSQINGEFTQPGWVPVHYIHRNLPRAELVAYYRAADVALITPLKDGMNLVAKEFCASQVDERGVVIISEFAGAALEFRDGAMIVNPNDFMAVAQAIHDASAMPKEQRRNRMRLLRDLVRENNVQRWVHSFTDKASSLDGERDARISESAQGWTLKTDQPDEPRGPGLVASAYVATTSSRTPEGKAWQPQWYAPGKE